jgi:hypothetical protein
MLESEQIAAQLNKPQIIENIPHMPTVIIYCLKCLRKIIAKTKRHTCTLFSSLLLMV